MIRFLLRLLVKSIQYSLVLISNIYSTQLFRFLLWLNCVEAGNGIRAVKSIPSLIISRRARRVLIGNGTVFNSYGDHSWYCKCSLWVREEATLIIGDNVGMNGVMIYASDRVEIHDNVKIGGGTRISDSNHHSLDYMERRCAITDKGKTAPVIIEQDVFIGANCTIMKGVTIGARSIIAAGSVIVKSVPAGSIAGGNPGKIIKSISYEHEC